MRNWRHFDIITAGAYTADSVDGCSTKTAVTGGRYEWRIFINRYGNGLGSYGSVQ
ncbi:MAG TPA: hypothetical protein VGL28_08920 [Steroidobacteraceae bacterium]